jgi:hemerythrin
MLLPWSEALELGLAFMDDTHREFVELLAAAEAADDAALPAAWQALVTHTEVHFGQEDAWMVATGFSSANCHRAAQGRAAGVAGRSGPRSQG